MSSSGSESESCCLCLVHEVLVAIGGDGATSQRFNLFPDADALETSTSMASVSRLRRGDVFLCLPAFSVSGLRLRRCERSFDGDRDLE